MTRTPGQRRYGHGAEGRLQAFEVIAQKLQRNPNVRPEMRQELTAKKVQYRYDRLIKELTSFCEREQRASGQQLTLTPRQERIFPLLREALAYHNDGTFDDCMRTARYVVRPTNPAELLRLYKSIH